MTQKKPKNKYGLGMESTTLYLMHPYHKSYKQDTSFYTYLHVIHTLNFTGSIWGQFNWCESDK